MDENMLEEFDAQLEGLRQTVASLPAGETDEDRAAVEGLNDLVKIFERMRASSARFLAKRDGTED